MNHNDLITAVAAVLDPIIGALGRGDEVKLNGLSAFEIVDRPARPGRNPQTGEAIAIAASRSVKFKAAKPLRDALNAPAAGDAD